MSEYRCIYSIDPDCDRLSKCTSKQAKRAVNHGNFDQNRPILVRNSMILIILKIKNMYTRAQ